LKSTPTNHSPRVTSASVPVAAASDCDDATPGSPHHPHAPDPDSQMRRHQKGHPHPPAPAHPPAPRAPPPPQPPPSLTPGPHNSPPQPPARNRPINLNYQLHQQPTLRPQPQVPITPPTPDPSCSPHNLPSIAPLAPSPSGPYHLLPHVYPQRKPQRTHTLLQRRPSQRRNNPRYQSPYPRVITPTHATNHYHKIFQKKRSKGGDPGLAAKGTDGGSAPGGPQPTRANASTSAAAN
jgi:hypothetical protein